MRADALRFFFLFAVCCLLLLPAKTGRAACASEKVSLYVPAPQGSQIERLALPFFEVWPQLTQRELSLNFLPGKGGSYAWSRLAGAPGNGCSLALVQIPSCLFLADLNDGMYRKGDLAIVSVFASVPNALWVSEKSPFQTLADLAAHVKKANDTPGGYSFFAGIGSYTDQHLATLQFNRAAGVKASYLPVLGSSQAIGSIAAQKADACWGYALSPESMPGMRALAVAAQERSSALPDVPTFQELHMDMISLSYFGIALPSSVSQEEALEMSSVMEAFMAASQAQAAMQSEGFFLLTIPRERLSVFIGERQKQANELLEEYSLIPRELLRH